MYSTYLDIQYNQSISFHIPGNTFSVYSVAFEAEQHLIYTRVAKANKPMSQIRAPYSDKLIQYDDECCIVFCTCVFTAYI